MSHNVAIYGTGAIGCCCAYVLTQAGCNVTVICRSNHDEIKAGGITIDAELWGKGLACHPRVVRTPKEAVQSGEFDFVLVTVKALPGTGVPAAIAPIVTESKTTIVLAQNGIGIEAEHAKAFPNNTLLSCSVLMPAEQVRPGHVVGVWFEHLEIGTFPSEAYTASAVARQSAELWTSTWKLGGGNATLYHDIQERRWTKLLMNATYNPIAALTLCRNTAFFGLGEEAVHLFREVQNEIIAVANALGYSAVNRTLADEHIKLTTDRMGTEGTEPSMLTDILRARPTEYQVILENPVRIANRLGVPIPRLHTLYVLMKGLDAAITRRTPGMSLLGTQI
ncbi:putative 2-dehydropantoate 2-reductase [Cercospora beticola]|uniref:2-dehydropantoate 2-reductase n=1 Tax=Cercospora beticola TaxID=122368 RepID=A0A2G5I2M7_CERBT|nr:putative 2-dehydropantoate 2-reductase [Cercospora beticola]PIA99020.1 putative 2-dehydropantoate 2-reductase [Cercospora beticola]WPB00854.1 hypothetical protein RHO25_005474 [Cercospora beticola]